MKTVDADAAPFPRTETLPLIAYERGKVGSHGMKIIPAPVQREWIQATTQGYARRCLPLMIANQAEWWILNDAAFTVTWNGGRRNSSIKIEYADGGTENRHAVSHFGHGILTITLPFFFRSPPGWNLTARGPANLPKDGVTALSGIIEADWTNASFTMNWQITRPGMPIDFGAGEPICAILPIHRDMFSSFVPEVRPISADAPEEAASNHFEESRRRWNEQVAIPGTPAHEAGQQRHYLKGETTEGSSFPDHQRKLRLPPFERVMEESPHSPGEVRS